jgi:hypothetical protein
MVFFVASGFGYTLPHLSEWLSGIQNPDGVVEEAFIFASNYWQRRQWASFVKCR